MKKLSLLIGGLVMTSVVMAQKPDASVPSTLEGQFGWNASTMSFAAPAIRYRYFVQDNIAVRVTLGIANTKTNTTIYEPNAVPHSAGTGSNIVKLNGWNAAIGGEYHFAGTDKLSPYAGLDILFSGGNNHYESENSNDGITYTSGDSRSGDSKYSGFGVNIVAGTDYYFAENFYLGLELGLGWNNITTKESESTVTVGSTTTTTKGGAEKKTSFLGNNAIGTFRLGWRF